MRRGPLASPQMCSQRYFSISVRPRLAHLAFIAGAFPLNDMPVSTFLLLIYAGLAALVPMAGVVNLTFARDPHSPFRLRAMAQA